MTPWLLIVACGLTLFLPVAWRLARSRLDPFEPIVLFSAAFGAMFVARPAAILVEDVTIYWGVDFRSELPRALLLALLGAVSFVWGYELRVGGELARRIPGTRPVDTRHAVGTALAVTALAIAALAILLAPAGAVDGLRILLEGRGPELGELLATSSTYVWYGSLLSVPAALVLTGLALHERSVPVGVAAVFVAALVLLRVLPVGGRIALLPLAGGVFALAYVVRGRRPRLRVLGVLGLVALLGSFFLLHTRDPTDDLTLRTAVSELADRPHAVFDPVLHKADAEMVLALSGALTAIPHELPHRWGAATIGNLVARPIPRELWEEKPKPPGETVVATVWPHVYPGLNPAFSPLMPLYWDFGLAGVALGMLLFGVSARALYEWFSGHHQELGAQIVFSASIWFVVIGARNDPVDTIVLAAFLIAPALFILGVSSTRTSRRATPAQQSS